jgi:hypothetical protein
VFVIYESILPGVERRIVLSSNILLIGPRCSLFLKRKKGEGQVVGEKRFISCLETYESLVFLKNNGNVLCHGTPLFCKIQIRAEIDRYVEYFLGRFLDFKTVFFRFMES